MAKKEWNEAAHNRKLEHIEKHLGPDALDTDKADEAAYKGGEKGMLRHLGVVYKQSLKKAKEHESAHWGQGGKSNPDSHTK